MEIIEQSILSKTKEQLDRVQYIGSCVIATPKAISSIKDEKILWQVPCFLLYKQFYFCRTKIVDKLIIDSNEIKSQALADWASQLKEENELMKGSLIKLLKSAHKKLGKYEFDPRTLEEIKNCLNLDYSNPWHDKLDAMASNFLITIEEIKQNYPQLMDY